MLVVNTGDFCKAACSVPHVSVPIGVCKSPEKMAKFGKSLRLLAPGCPKALLWDVRLARFSEGSGLGGTATPWQSFSSFSLAWFSEEKDWLQAECMTLCPTYCSCCLGDLRFAVSWNILIDYCEPWQLSVTSAVRKNAGARGNFIHTPCIKVRLILTKRLFYATDLPVALVTCLLQS